ncbi:uncharacterized protein EV422DRAFT_524948 [Fimicolochytrium jonesii]|uniref:uncharacterized protein n=1 Tax=Fimicolochytrium jonesii TaxID=1396493 RepID=UPI0022FDED59|nr:uncharacterized protein EV422DRAFT_524948 [Fimicolochytrium jonesii]KAI8822675.1 hypothetical protein EV422DRAFT_524948 [Fimicolochytrium jonesii]
MAGVQPPILGQAAPTSKVLWNQILFLATGLLSTLGIQKLHYMGAADGKSMLTVLTTYIGMIAIILIPAPKSEKRRLSVSSVEHPKVLLVAVMDVLGNLVLTIGQFSVGSGVRDESAETRRTWGFERGESTMHLESRTLTAVSCRADTQLYQVIYASMVVFTALFSWLFLRRSLNLGQVVGVLVITFGLSINALDKPREEEGEHDPSETQPLLGFLITLTGTCIYSGVYTLNDYMITSSPHPSSPRQQCFWLGTYSTLICFTVMGFMSLPTLRAMPLNDSGVISLYAALCVSSLAHNVTYFQLLESTGAVATGVIQALRAVLVFTLSDYFFCAQDAHQCFTTVKGCATFVVVLGVLAFASSKRKHVDAVSPATAVGGGGGGSYEKLEPGKGFLARSEMVKVLKA